VGLRSRRSHSTCHGNGILYFCFWRQSSPKRRTERTSTQTTWTLLSVVSRLSRCARKTKWTNVPSVRFVHLKGRSLDGVEDADPAFCGRVYNILWLGRGVTPSLAGRSQIRIGHRPSDRPDSRSTPIDTTEKHDLRACIFVRWTLVGGRRRSHYRILRKRRADTRAVARPAIF
jgi:hypothetical protein